MFWRSTVLPVAGRLASALAQWLAPAFGRNLALVADTDRIEALSPDRAALWERVAKADFLTVNEKRQMTGFGPVDGGENLSAIDTRKAGFNPDQPRDELGRWTDTGASDPRVLPDTTPDNDWMPGAQYAQDTSRYSVDLLAEEAAGGHTYREHVGKSESDLKSCVREEATKIIERGDDFRGLSIGSFTSLESANRLVSSTIAQNKDTVDKVARGESAVAFLSGRFGPLTGYEAYLQTYHAQPYIRDTYGVGVVILRDARTDKGWRVQSAFPRR